MYGEKVRALIPAPRVAQPGLRRFEQGAEYGVVFDRIETAELRRRSAERHELFVDLRLNAASDLAILIGKPRLPIDRLENAG